MTWTHGLTKELGRGARTIAVCFLLGGVVAACENVQSDANYPRKDGNKAIPNPTGERQTVFGPSGLTFGGGGSKQEGDISGTGGGIGVNGFLWRASLDTTAFMPLTSADPFGGVIITDWYSPPETPGERFKVTVYILDRQLRADGLKVAVFRQQLANGVNWIDASVSPDTATRLENAILARARQMRLEFVSN